MDRFDKASIRVAGAARSIMLGLLLLMLKQLQGLGTIMYNRMAQRSFGLSRILVSMVILALGVQGEIHLVGHTHLTLILSFLGLSYNVHRSGPQS